MNSRSVLNTVLAIALMAGCEKQSDGTRPKVHYDGAYGIQSVCRLTQRATWVVLARPVAIGKNRLVGVYNNETYDLTPVTLSVSDVLKGSLDLGEIEVLTKIEADGASSGGEFAIGEEAVFFLVQNQFGVFIYDFQGVFRPRLGGLVSKLNHVPIPPATFNDQVQLGKNLVQCPEFAAGTFRFDAGVPSASDAGPFQ